MDLQSTAYYRTVNNFRRIVDDTQDHLCLVQYEQYLWSSDSECAKLWRGLFGATSKSKTSAKFEVHVEAATYSKFVAERRREMRANQKKSYDSAYSSGSDDETFYYADLPTMFNLVFEDVKDQLRVFEAKQHKHNEDSEDNGSDYGDYWAFGKDLEEKIMIFETQKLNYIDSEDEDDQDYRPRKHTYRKKILKD